MWSRVSSRLGVGVALFWLAMPAVAGADHAPDHPCTGEADTRGGDGEASGECEGAGGGTTPECDPDSTTIAYYAGPPEDLLDTYILFGAQNTPPEGMTFAAAYNCAGRYLGGPHLVPDPDWPDIQGARDVARARVAPPLPTPSVSPSEAVVKLPTWLWVDALSWQPASATASQGAVTVRVDAQPVGVTWDLEEGSRTCEGPGIAWSEAAQQEYEAQPESTRGRGNPACTFTFQHSSTVNEDDLYHADVTVTWEFSWWLNGAPQGVFGSVDRTTTFDLRVGEIQALITDY